MPSVSVIRTRNLYGLTNMMSLMNRDKTSFWDSIHKSINTRIQLASMIDNCTDEENIVHM